MVNIVHGDRWTNFAIEHNKSADKNLSQEQKDCSYCRFLVKKSDSDATSLPPPPIPPCLPNIALALSKIKKPY